jgi:hypothetical protein
MSESEPISRSSYPSSSAPTDSWEPGDRRVPMLDYMRIQGPRSRRLLPALVPPPMPLDLLQPSMRCPRRFRSERPVDSEPPSRCRKSTLIRGGGIRGARLVMWGAITLLVAVLSAVVSINITLVS